METVVTYIHMMIWVLITDKPCKPEGPLEVLEVYGDRCRLTWKPPVDDGGLPITHYLVEMLDVKKASWQEVGKIVGDTQCGVPGLEAKRIYKFRVKAVNSEGESSPLITDTETLAKDPYGMY